MTTVTLVYPYFRPKHDKSIFRFPPLGLGYVLSYLRRHGISANLIDCTFLSEKEALEIIKKSMPKIVGIYSMFSMKHTAIKMADLLKNSSNMLVAGGPLPTLCPEDFLGDFDVVVVGEGEETMLELVRAVENKRPLSTVRGIVYKKKGDEAEVVYTPPRELIEDLDSLPFPARGLFDNESYKSHYRKKFGYTITSIITSRGCPFNCDFCSRAVFGNRFRVRSAVNVVDEMEDVQAMEYERIWFADDCFTLKRKRLFGICDEIIRRGLKIDWECLSRVDTVDRETAIKMRKAGCLRVFFGIESGNDSVLALMNKQVTVDQARKAVFTTKSVGIQVGAFFIVGYPGETDNTILDTVKFASSLPLDYLSFTLPYPILGTRLYDGVKEKIMFDDWNGPKHRSLIEHNLLYHSDFSEAKLKFAIFKGSTQFNLRKFLGTRYYRFLDEPFELLTDNVFRILR
jgi:anaerobic magnesium-protoporphyrin IX monomethyl ester cyclase